MEDGHYAQLVCWSCGTAKDVVMSRPPQFAFEVARAANDVQWVGMMDMKYHRALVFCSTSCTRAQMTKAGTFRLRPKRAAGKE